MPHQRASVLARQQTKTIKGVAPISLMENEGGSFNEPGLALAAFKKAGQKLIKQKRNGENLFFNEFGEKQWYRLLKRIETDWSMSDKLHLRSWLKKLLVGVMFFDQMESETFEVLAPDFELREFTKGATVFRQHEQGDLFYYILAGSVAVYIDKPEAEMEQIVGNQDRDWEDKATLVANLKPGSSFGEVALLGGEHGRRMASIKAVENCLFLTLTKSAFLKARKETNFEDRDQLEKDEFVRTQQPFNLLDAASQLSVRYNMTSYRTWRDDVVFNAGDPCNGEKAACLYFVREGTYTVILKDGTEGDEANPMAPDRKGLALAQLGPGEMFGDEEIFSGRTTRKYGVICTSATACLYELPMKYFTRFFRGANLDRLKSLAEARTRIREDRRRVLVEQKEMKIAKQPVKTKLKLHSRPSPLSVGHSTGPDRALGKHFRPARAAPVLHERLRQERDASRDKQIALPQLQADPALRRLDHFNKDKSWATSPTAAFHKHTQKMAGRSPTAADQFAHAKHSPHNQSPSQHKQLSYQSNAYSHHSLPTTLPLRTSPTNVANPPTLSPMNQQSPSFASSSGAGGSFASPSQIAKNTSLSKLAV